MKPFNALGLALQFLTRLPLPRNIPYSPKALGWSVVFYPVTGLLIGGTLALLRILLGDHAPLLASSLLLAAWVLITGGLHLDGLADCADAWVGGQGNKEKSLGIMKDPYSGPIAVAAVVLLLLVKFSALAEMPANKAWMNLLWMPATARAFIPLLLLSTPYVRFQGLGSPLAENLPRLPALLSASLALLGALLAVGVWPILAASLAALLLRRLMLERLGGCTGDTLGASIEIIEAVMLAVFTLSARQG